MYSARKNTLRVSILAGVLILAGTALAQQDSTSSSDQPSDTSVAAAAREARKNKTVHAKKVLTDDDVVPQRGPLPPLSFNGDDNVDKVIEAIGIYSKTHTKDETEQVVHEWYDEYDSILQAAIRDMMETSGRRSSTIYNGYWGCQDSPNYQNCIARRRAELRGSHDDQMQSSGFTVGRIQQAFFRMRRGLISLGLNYKWFRVRSGNGIGYM
jgi:hypothetical protein